MDRRSSPSRRPIRSLSLVLLATLTSVAVACGGAPGSPAPSLEPRELVVAALRDTASLKAVHAVLKVTLREGSGREYALNVEGSVDIADRELDVTGRLEQTPPVGSPLGTRLIVVGGFAYATAPDGRWTYVSEGNAMGGLPTTAQVAEQVIAAVQDPATSVRAEGSEACGDRTCDRIRVEVPRPVAWKALMGMIHAARPDRPGPGQSGVGPTLEPVPQDFPGFAIDVWVDQRTHRLDHATNSSSFGHTTVAITIALSAHDVPASIVAPSMPPRPTPR